MTDTAETNRDRVRRLLFRPLDFRKPRGVADADHAAALDALADDLAYMTDERLQALEQVLRSKGEGALRNLWPGAATVRGFAELIQPRPIEELPALLSWFGSVEGPRCIAEGTLVETFLYVAKRKVPPATDSARQLIARDAADNRRRIEVIAGKVRGGWPISPEDQAWQRWYLDLDARCRVLVAAERDRRGKAA